MDSSCVETPAGQEGSSRFRTRGSTTRDLRSRHAEERERWRDDRARESDRDSCFRRNQERSPRRQRDGESSSKYNRDTEEYLQESHRHRIRERNSHARPRSRSRSRERDDLYGR